MISFLEGSPGEEDIETGEIRQFDFGYAITAWKAQGSEWNNVVFIEEYFNKMTKEENKRLLYTAITRAREKLIILR